MNRIFMTRLPALKRFAATSILGVAFMGGALIAQDHQPQSPVPPEQLQHALSLSNAFRAVTKAVSPSVVNIRSTQRVEMPQGDARRSPLDDELFRRFFGDQFPDGLQMPEGQTPERVGQGSGVIVSRDGYIVTNNHVVENASEIKVILNGGDEHDATVVGTDPETDLAVIRIEASGLTPAVLGNSDSVEVGDWVIAIGSPFGYDHSVTAGIVSAKGRQVGIIRDPRGFTGFEDFIQTDAAINPGNSGGPLVNLYGEIVGVNTAISTRTGVNVGIGFAIPSNMVRPVMQSIMETGTVRRGALGVSIQPLTPEHAEYVGFDGTNGAVINQIYPNSAAEEAGLRVGDIVTAIDGKKVTDTRSLMNTVAARAPGDTVSLEVYRNGRTIKREVRLGDRSAQFARGQSALNGGPGGSGPAPVRNLGLSVQELTPELRSQLGVSEDTEGVVVTRVAPDSIAARRGIARGDVISRVDNQRIESLEQFNQLISNADLARGVSVQVFRGGAARLIILKNDRAN